MALKMVFLTTFQNLMQKGIYVHGEELLGLGDNEPNFQHIHADVATLLVYGLAVELKKRLLGLVFTDCRRGFHFSTK